MRGPCGSDLGYHAHLDAGEVPCNGCRDAHALEAALRREATRLRTQPLHPAHYREALAGREPAEALLQADRHLLVATLCRWGWSLPRIAEHCRMTWYTTLRIRDALGLAAATADRSAA